MSKYDNLNPRTELEQVITNDLKRALEKRDFQVKHNGTPISHATGNKPDIEIWDDEYFICVEVTKRNKSAQDGEYQSIKDHLVQAQKSSKKKCFCVFISPETYHRTFSSIRDSNRINSKRKDLKILPLSFAAFELFITKLIERPKNFYPKHEILQLFSRTEEYIDDEAVLRLLFNTLFSDDVELKHEIAVAEENKHQQTVQSLISDLAKLENDMRKNGIATHNEAIKNVIYLVFIKLYEEKREYEQKINRFSRLGFAEFQDNINDRTTACHKLFELIKEDGDLVVAKMFNEHDLLAEKMRDKFVFDNFIVPFEKYFFYTTKVDGLGAAYEVLGQLSGKDTKAGQFFTPENVVRFMVMLADLKSDDVVLDHACGTARFLIYAMYAMIDKVSGGNTASKEKHIKEEQLFGTDFDSYVSKLSKMNMYIHGDGKTNIQDKNGLLLFDKDGTIDAILTNPPLGNLDYTLESYDDYFLKDRMSVIPRKNITQEKLDTLNAKLKTETVELKRKRIEEKIKQLLQSEQIINVTGHEMKGGALFVESAWHYLKATSNTDMPIEWRGGKLVVIVDEGLLNTDDYSAFRDIVKTHFYIKAVISLTSDTFVPVSKTLTKTSVLFLVKKTDRDALQQEPIFFAYVDRVGLNTKRKVCDNHLFDEDNTNSILGVYNSFRDIVLRCYKGASLNTAKLSSLLKTGKSITIKGKSYYYIRNYSEVDNRLDFRFYDPRFDAIKKFMKSKDILHLKDIVLPDGVSYGLTASGKEDGAIPFINIENLTDSGFVDHTNLRYVDKTEPNLLLKQGDLLISRSRLIGLSSIITKREVNSTYGSYIIRFRLDTSKVDPLFVAKFINSKKGRLQTELLKTGAVGENINSDQLLSIAIPHIDKPKQSKVLEEMAEHEEKYKWASKMAEEHKIRAMKVMEAVTQFTQK